MQVLGLNWKKQVFSHDFMYSNISESISSTSMAY
jgi:hypothetical protein